MTSARMDSDLGCMVFPIVLTFGDQPPQEIGVVRAGLGPEQAVAELAAALVDAADIMVVGGDEAIRIARARYLQLQQPLGGDVVAVDFRRDGVDPALVEHDQGVLSRLAREVTGHAIAEARTLTAAEVEQLEHRGDGGARLVAVAEDEQEVVVTRGQLRGHCAHDIALSAPCAVCDRG